MFARVKEEHKEEIHKYGKQISKRGYSKNHNLNHEENMLLNLLAKKHGMKAPKRQNIYIREKYTMEMLKNSKDNEKKELVLVLNEIKTLPGIKFPDSIKSTAVSTWTEIFTHGSSSITWLNKLKDEINTHLEKPIKLRINDFKHPEKIDKDVKQAVFLSRFLHLVTSFIQKKIIDAESRASFNYTKLKHLSKKLNKSKKHLFQIDQGIEHVRNKITESTVRHVHGSGTTRPADQRQHPQAPGMFNKEDASHAFEHSTFSMARQYNP